MEKRPAAKRKGGKGALGKMAIDVLGNEAHQSRTMRLLRRHILLDRAD